MFEKGQIVTDNNNGSVVAKILDIIETMGMHDSTYTYLLDDGTGREWPERELKAADENAPPLATASSCGAGCSSTTRMQRSARVAAVRPSIPAE